MGGRYELAECADEDASVFHYQASRLVVELSIANYLNHFPEQSNFTAGEREREREGEEEGKRGGGGGRGGERGEREKERERMRRELYIQRMST